jgi:hypothetical protein
LLAGGLQDVARWAGHHVARYRAFDIDAHSQSLADAVVREAFTGLYCIRRTMFISMRNRLTYLTGGAVLRQASASLMTAPPLRRPTPACWQVAL